MSHYRFYKDVPIQVYAKDEPLDATWTLGYWEFAVDRPQWGLMHNRYPTQMSYGLDYAKPKEAIAKRNNKDKIDPDDPDWQLWYFDVGNKITVLVTDLEQAFKDLGIWE